MVSTGRSMRRQVAGRADHDEARAGNRVGHGPGLGRRDDLVLVPDDHQRRDSRQVGEHGRAVGPIPHGAEGADDPRRPGSPPSSPAPARPWPAPRRRVEAPSTLGSIASATASAPCSRAVAAAASRALRPLGRVGLGTGVHQHQPAHPRPSSGAGTRRRRSPPSRARTDHLVHPQRSSRAARSAA